MNHSNDPKFISAMLIQFFYRKTVKINNEAYHYYKTFDFFESVNSRFSTNLVKSEINSETAQKSSPAAKMVTVNLIIAIL